MVGTTIPGNILSSRPACPASPGRAGSGCSALVVLDESPAVSRRVPVHELTERCRSLGLAVQVAAQSWQSLTPEEAERSRLASTAAGEVWLMCCPDPEPLCLLAGTRAVIEAGRKIIGPGRYSEEGTAGVGG